MELAQLEKSTPLEVFVHVKQHLLEQNAKSLGNGGGCAYRGHFDRSCGAGCLMSEGDYNRLNAQVVRDGKALKLPMDEASRTTIEGLSWCNLTEERLVPWAHKALIIRLQSVHDTDPVDRWAGALDLVEMEVMAGVYDVEGTA